MFDSNQFSFFEIKTWQLILMEYLLFPIILFLLIFLSYLFLKKRILRDEKEDLINLKLLKDLLDSGTIDQNEFDKKRKKIISKW